MRILPTVLFLLISLCSFSQDPREQATDSTQTDSIRKAFLLQLVGDGYFPTKLFDFDLRYLIKFNQYEGIRTGLGGRTTDALSESFKIDGYTVYGFKDDRFKYSIRGGYRLSPKRNTWIYLSYTDDLEETGSSSFLTDKRLFSLFEPRLLNIDLFHRHITQAFTVEHQLFYKVIAETEFAHRRIDPTYDYLYTASDGGQFSGYQTSSIKLSAQWSPFSTIEYIDDRLVETEKGYPHFTFQYTKAIDNILDSDLNFSRFDFRVVHKMFHKEDSKSEIILSTGFANGDVPLQYLYHAYPNNVNKETILQRFSVAGITSFETMYFNEFFSDRFGTLIFKHHLPSFQISPRFKPQIVLTSKFAIGSMDNIERHQGIAFNTLDQGYFESGFEINRLLLGFGLSFAYRYGSYHLPDFEDNFAFKFTFYPQLN